MEGRCTADVKVQEDRWIHVPAFAGERAVDAPIQLRPGVAQDEVLVKVEGGEVQTTLVQLRRGLRLIEEEQG
jgi:hypothetical protein